MQAARHPLRWTGNGWRLGCLPAQDGREKSNIPAGAPRAGHHIPTGALNVCRLIERPAGTLTRPTVAANATKAGTGPWISMISGKLIHAGLRTVPCLMR